MRRKRRYAHQLVLRFAVRALESRRVWHAANLPHQHAAFYQGQSRTTEAARDWQPPASMNERSCELLRHTLDGVRAVFRVLVADLPGLLERCGTAPRLNFFQTIEGDHCNARFRRLSFHWSCLSRRDIAAPICFDVCHDDG